ncbi:hypothetical protein BDR26DRAFT_1009600 [Obelidium mucronatum]|nr:hypothetical protein BDR26DRAFT_1009600 [Obelidium mucronatum]
MQQQPSQVGTPQSNNVKYENFNHFKHHKVSIRRAEQNRKAQQAFRERRQAVLDSLRRQVELLEQQDQQLKLVRQQLEYRIVTLELENNSLKQALSMRGCTSGTFGFPPALSPGFPQKEASYLALLGDVNWPEQPPQPAFGPSPSIAINYQDSMNLWVGQQARADPNG